MGRGEPVAGGRGVRRAGASCNAPALKTRHKPTLPRNRPYLRSNLFTLSSSLRVKRLTENYYASLSWLFKFVRFSFNCRGGTTPVLQ